MAALARMGGPEAATFLRGVLDGASLTSVEEPEELVREALSAAWRLDQDPPVNALLRYAEGTTEDFRNRALYSLWRLRAPAAASVFLGALNDRSPALRAIAAAALTGRYA